jgi:diguanylate cyclase (GGDEF)-like protein/PAS domain S-box-containing protein
MPDRPDDAKPHFDSLAENPANLNGVLDAVFDGVYLVDTQRQIQEWNAGAVALTGFSREEVRHRCCADNILVHVDECGTELCRSGCPLQKTLLDGQTRQSKVFLRHKQGYRVPVAVRIVPIRDAHSNIIGALETFREIGEADRWQARISELERAAYLDALTGIPNRRFVEMQLERLLREFEATGEPFAVLIIDLDEFKAVNDTYGHDVGDRVLRNVSATLMNSLRGRDLLGRWGGDEFVMLLGSASHQQCAAIAERARMLAAQTATPIASGYVGVTVSIGGAVSAPGDTAEQLLKRADAQLYITKDRGRNCWSVE